MSDTPAVDLPRINTLSPEFSAKTAHEKRTLAEYRGKWLALFLHLSERTPVCTTGFIASVEVAIAADRGTGFAFTDWYFSKHPLSA